MKNLANLNSTEWCDIIFENKNKEYGAFALRQSSWKRHLIAFLLIVTATILVSFLPTIIESVSAKGIVDKVTINEVFTITQFEDKKDEILEALTPAIPEPPKFVKMDKLVPPTIVENDQVTENDETMKAMSELVESKAAIGAFTVEEGSTDPDAVRKTFENLVTSEGSGNGKGATTAPVNFAEVMPEFPGGDAELYKFISENLKYPIVDQENGTEGRISVRFVVDKNGNISNIEVIRGISPSCDREAIRVIKSMPRWIPGKQNGAAVPVYFNLPIVFKLKK